MNSIESFIKYIETEIIDQDSYDKLCALNNEHVLRIISEYTALCKPNKVIVITDSKEDIEFVRKKALELGEEAPLKMKGHTIHFDNIFDQGRDKENTAVLVEEGEKLSPRINTKDRDAALDDIFKIMDGIMKGKDMLVRFFCLGPKDSKFTICALQLTDSYYVGHSEDILYRSGYEEFKNLKGSENFFYFIHSAGELENHKSKNIDKRRVFMDLVKNRVLSTNTQYAGNTVGLKKLALRLAINKANNENWLAEHMFIMGIKPPGKSRVSYFSGAYPSACGKTSTAMIPEQTILGDDIAYLRAYKDGYMHAVNIEQGIFGIIQDVNPIDDPAIYEALTTPRELIYSNVLIKNDIPYWLGMGKELPKEGINFSAEWFDGKKDKAGKTILAAHPNARYTIRLQELGNADSRLDDPDGVPIRGIFYGGRDSDTNVPVFESLNWEHGVYIGATIESETTTATIGQVGLRTQDPMANIDFLVIPLGKYLRNHQKFGNSLKNPPKVFAMNYFLKNKENEYMNLKTDKKVWVTWAEGRTYNDYDAIKTPVGYIPRYKDLKSLFKLIFKKNYTEKEYAEQFSLRVPKLLEKLDRMEKMYEKEGDIPEFFWKILREQRKQLLVLKEKHKKDDITPFEL